MNRSTNISHQPFASDMPTHPSPRLPHRWWATPDYAMDDGEIRSVRRPRSAQIRAYALAGRPLVRAAA